VRSVETQGGRISGVVTERGSIACGAVLLAAGIWSRFFSGNLGIDLPQLKVMGSVMRTHPLPGGPEVSVAGRRFGWRRREDGGYIVSQADATIFDIVPDSFRLLNDFRPMIATGLRTLRLRVGRRFVEEARLARRWSPDEVTPFEQVRTADPQPAEWVLNEAAQRVAEAYPVFAGMRIAGKWGGLIDVMPDALPVIGSVESLPGLFMATGFSGHGFGIGPGAGRLAAELVLAAAPCVDPTPFRLERFSRTRVRTEASR
jgi:glycine/D-amino acid oxidase-like deaminating enzyme